MKVLVFLTQFYQLGGAERLGVELAEELNRRAIPADVLSLYREDLPGVAAARDTLLHRGIPAVRFLGMQVHPRVTRLVPALQRLRRLIGDHGYDIVETSMPTPAAMAAWAVRGTPAWHVAGLHDVFRRDRYARMMHCVWRFSVRNSPRTRFYAISEYARTHWLEYSRTPPERTRTIHNAVSDDYFGAVAQPESLRAELGVVPGSRLVLFVGRILKRKGIDTVLEAVGPLLQAENLSLVCVGSWDQPPEGFFLGEVGLLERMRRRIVLEGWSNRVLFLGYRRDVPRLMAASDLLVHPARIEGFGLVLAEALAVGIPVVASRVDGIPEVLTGTDSTLVPPDDPAALRGAILRVLARSPEETQSARQKGWARAENFRSKRRADEMVQLFQDVIAGRF